MGGHLCHWKRRDTGDDWPIQGWLHRMRVGKAADLGICIQCSRGGIWKGHERLACQGQNIQTDGPRVLGLREYLGKTVYAFGRWWAIAVVFMTQEFGVSFRVRELWSVSSPVETRQKVVLPKPESKFKKSLTIFVYLEQMLQIAILQIKTQPFHWAAHRIEGAVVWHTSFLLTFTL